MDNSLESNTSATKIDDKNGVKNLKTITIITSVVAVCGIGFGIYGMIKNNGPEISNLKVETETSEIETKTNDNGTITTISDSKMDISWAVDELISKYIKNSIYPQMADLSNNFDDPAIRVAIALSNSYDNINGSLVPNEFDSTSIDSRHLQEKYKELFGEDLELKDYTISKCLDIDYDATQQRFIVQPLFATGKMYFHDYKLDSYSVKDDGIVANISIIYATVNPSSDSRSEFPSKLTLDNEEINIPFDIFHKYFEIDDLPKIIEQYGDRLPKYQITFEKKDSRYIFKSFSNITQ